MGKEEEKGTADNEEEFDGLSEMSTEVFFATAAVTQDEVCVAARVDISGVILGAGKESRVYADKVSEMIWREGTHYWLK
jgi:hypothetical protein